MDHISNDDLPAVGESAHAVVREAKAAGVWIFGGGVQWQQASIVATDGTVTDGPVLEKKAVIGGFSIIELASREETLAWADRIAKACRCARSCLTRSPDPAEQCDAPKSPTVRDVK